MKIYKRHLLSQSATYLAQLVRSLGRSLHRLVRPTPADYRARLNMTLRDWLLYHQREIALARCRWMGLRAIKNPLDAWIYQEIIHDVRPGVIVEIGSAEGGSTLYFAHLLDLLGAGIVISVDNDRSRYRASHPRITAVTGDSSSPAIVAQVAALCEGKTVLVIHDGDHAKPQVLKDLAAYAPLVTLGSYFIVEDGIVDLFQAGDGIGLFVEGPLAAIDEFLPRHPEFVADAERERYILTYCPRGFLRKIGKETPCATKSSSS